MADDPRIGQVLAGTYRLTRLLGEGGMGAVYEAEHVRLPNRFAVKFLRAEALRQPEVFERFRREAEIASAIRHPNIVLVIDFNKDEAGAPYMVLEYLEGEDLAARLEHSGRLPVEQAVRIADDTGDALHAAHGAGVVHRDLKPRNIYLVTHKRRDDFVKVVDFGISKVIGSTSLVTRTGTVMGTPNYMSPEQVEGQVSEIDRRTDVWALGCILYEMLTGRLAFEAKSLMGVFYQVLSQNPPPLRELRPDVPPGVEEVVARALQKRRADRYPTIAEMCEELRSACGTARVAQLLPPEPEEEPASESLATVVTPAPRPAVDAGPRSSAAAVVSPATFTGAAAESRMDLAPTRSKRWPMVAAGLGLGVVAAVGAGWFLVAEPEPDTATATAVPPQPKTPAAPRAAPATPPGTPALVAPPPAAAPAAAAAPEPAARSTPPPERPKTRKVTITIESEPSGATVRRLPGGERLCVTTPCPVTVDKGEGLRVRVDKAAHEPVDRTVPTRQSRSFRVILKPAVLD